MPRLSRLRSKPILTRPRTPTVRKALASCSKALAGAFWEQSLQAATQPTLRSPLLLDSSLPLRRIAENDAVAPFQQLEGLNSSALVSPDRGPALEKISLPAAIQQFLWRTTQIEAKLPAASSPFESFKQLHLSAASTRDIRSLETSAGASPTPKSSGPPGTRDAI